jgi:hypothetical protein
MLHVPYNNDEGLIVRLNLKNWMINDISNILQGKGPKLYFAFCRSIHDLLYFWQGNHEHKRDQNFDPQVANN